VVYQLLNKEVQHNNKQEAEKGGNEKAAKNQVYICSKECLKLLALRETWVHKGIL